MTLNRISSLDQVGVIIVEIRVIQVHPKLSTGDKACISEWSKVNCKHSSDEVHSAHTAYKTGAVKVAHFGAMNH